jgi:hypothetical protein
VEMLQLFVMCSVINKHGDMQELQKQKDVKWWATESALFSCVRKIAKSNC